jgi:hypothetical protein
MVGHLNQAERTYHVLGVPLRTGSLYPGNENDAQAYREVQLLGALLGDPRIRIIEVTEYAALRDLDQRYVSKLVDLLAEGLALR